MEEMGSPSVYLCTLLPQTPSFMFRSMFDINVCFAASKARWTLSFQNRAVPLVKITVPIHIFIVVFNAVWPDLTFGPVPKRDARRPLEVSVGGLLMRQ